MKRWEILSLVKTDFFQRALPWMEIILENKQLANDLNLNWSNRTSVALIYGLLAAIAVWGLWSAGNGYRRRIMYRWLTESLMLLFIDFSLKNEVGYLPWG